jgi:hypothetical protein
MQRVGDGAAALAVLSLIGFPAIVVFAIGLAFLVWVLRLALMAVLLLAAVVSFGGARPPRT